jgi:hypothetical protein
MVDRSLPATMAEHRKAARRFDFSFSLASLACCICPPPTASLGGCLSARAFGPMQVWFQPRGLSNELFVSFDSPWQSMPPDLGALLPQAFQAAVEVAAAAQSQRRRNPCDKRRHSSASCSHSDKEIGPCRSQRCPFCFLKPVEEKRCGVWPHPTDRVQRPNGDRFSWRKLCWVETNRGAT